MNKTLKTDPTLSPIAKNRAISFDAVPWSLSQLILGADIMHILHRYPWEDEKSSMVTIYTMSDLNSFIKMNNGMNITRKIDKNSINPGPNMKRSLT